MWTAVAGGFAITALTGLWIIAFELFHMPPNPLLPANFVSSPLFADAIIAGASFLAGITEEKEVLQTGPRRHVCAPVKLRGQTVFSPRVELMNRTCPPTTPFTNHLTCPFRIMCIAS